MTHNEADTLETLHHILYHLVRGKVYESQYVGTVKMGEEELERDVFHDASVGYNFLAYWKRHAGDGRDSQGSYKLTHSKHPQYVERCKQVHFTIFVNEDNPEWLDVYAHYEYDWRCAPLKHIREVEFSAAEGVKRGRSFLLDQGVNLYDLRQS